MFDLPKRRRGLFWTGVALIFGFSLIVGFLNVGILYILGIPLIPLILGVIFVWFSDVRIPTKLLLSLSPFPIIIITFVVMVFVRTSQAEEFLIPASYRGDIVVFFDEKCGQPPKFNAGMRQYELDQNGILITQHSVNDGLLNRRFFVMSENGERFEIPAFGRQDFETEKQEWGTFNESRMGDLTKETPGVFWSYGAPTHYISKNSISYIVSSYDELESTDSKVRLMRREEFTRRAGAALEKCRGEKIDDTFWR